MRLRVVINASAFLDVLCARVAHVANMFDHDLNDSTGNAGVVIIPLVGMTRHQVLHTKHPLKGFEVTGCLHDVAEKNAHVTGDMAQ